MQVKKFEAGSMKEALSMIKKELGPEAIILSARDNSHGFGLKSSTSVEVTAAISQKMLQKKALAERKMRAQDLERFQSTPASQQKKFINQIYNRTVSDHQRPQISSTARKYIEIFDEPKGETLENEQPQMAVAKPPVLNPVKEVSAQPPAPVLVPQVKENKQEVEELKKEIHRLQKVISDFQSVPQNFISVHPGAEKGVPYEFSFIYEKMRRVGVAEDTTLQLIDEARKTLPESEQRKKHLVDAWMAQKILKTTRVSNNPLEGKIHIFTGPSGQGKTSSLVKLASQMVVNHSKKIALVTGDTFKVGAADQLKIFAQILNVPFAVIRNQKDWQHVLQELADYDHILMDFPNVPLRDIEDIDQVKKLLPPEGVKTRTHLVLSATSKNSDVEETARRYRFFKFNDVIFTRLDEAVHHGLIYNFQKKFETPIHSFGVGSKIPEDFEIATRERVLDLLFKLTKINSSERGPHESRLG